MDKIMKEVCNWQNDQVPEKGWYKLQPKGKEWWKRGTLCIFWWQNADWLFLSGYHQSECVSHLVKPKLRSCPYYMSLQDGKKNAWISSCNKKLPNSIRTNFFPTIFQGSQLLQQQAWNYCLQWENIWIYLAQALKLTEHNLKLLADTWNIQEDPIESLYYLNCIKK